VQFAVTFLATGLADVTMLIAHHLPELRREAPAWPRDPGRVGAWFHCVPCGWRAAAGKLPYPTARRGA
jgi:hypothetical protein